MVHKIVSNRRLLVVLAAIILALALVRVYSMPLAPAEARNHTFRELLIEREGQVVRGWLGLMANQFRIVEVRGDYVLIETVGEPGGRVFVQLSFIHLIEDRPTGE
jgi:hypothetical protein